MTSDGDSVLVLVVNDTNIPGAKFRTSSSSAKLSLSTD